MKNALLNINPTIGYADHFLEAEALEALLADLATLETKAAKVLNASTSEASSERVAETSRIPRGRYPSVTAATERVARLFNLESIYCELPVFIHYQPGGEYKPHFDASPTGTMPPQMLSKERGNQRVFTAVLYLNDGFDGGATRFPRLNLEIEPRANRLAFWQNTQSCSPLPHPLSLHQGCPVERGEKRILTFWFRGRPERTG